MGSSGKFECQLCDYNYVKEDDLKQHLRSNHNHFKCDVCDVSLKTDMKLKNHICKVHVKNPSFGSPYTKGWYDANGCTPVFCS
jgi:hypothetical protein